MSESRPMSSQSSYSPATPYGSSNRMRPVSRSEKVMMDSSLERSMSGMLSLSSPSNLKGKIQALEEIIDNQSEELNNQRAAVQTLLADKSKMEATIDFKIHEARKQFSNELLRLEEEMKRHFSHQKAENSRLQQQITALKGEKTSMQQQMLGMQRRIAELEEIVGAAE
eukprot:GILI01008770.1.p1 GENE.GILI01008770.1~~GILI01008770.1.p1  ORF type:complete len:168 (-),score=40.88 GILI01008770.1:323-826(-)